MMDWSTLYGRLDYGALPFYSPIAFAGAAVTVLAGVAVVAIVLWTRSLPMLWRDWLTSTDHKKLGIMYVVLALVLLLRGFVDALMMRAQQAFGLNDGGYLPPEHYDQIFSAHGTIMILFMAMPFLTGLMNFVVPLQIGARDVAFPQTQQYQLLADRRGRRAGADFTGVGQVQPSGLDGLSAALRAGVQPRYGRGLLDLGAAGQRCRYDADGDQFHRHHRQASRPGDDLDASADVHLDGALRLDPNRLGLPRPDRRGRPSGPRSQSGDALFYQ